MHFEYTLSAAATQARRCILLSMSNDVTPEDGSQWLKENGDALMDALRRSTEDANERIKNHLEKLKAGSEISIADMFEMQMLMNKLSQLSEISTGVVSAGNAAISAMARNIKS